MPSKILNIPVLACVAYSTYRINGDTGYWNTALFGTKFSITDLFNVSCSKLQLIKRVTIFADVGSDPSPSFNL